MTSEDMTSARVETQPLITRLSEVRISQDDTARRRAQRLLKRQADMTAYSARRFADAVRAGDLQAARRWKREYQLSTACCRAAGLHGLEAEIMDEPWRRKTGLVNMSESGSSGQ